MRERLISIVVLSPKAPDSEHLRGLPRRVISRAVYLTSK
jgi:hypothetical protein